MTQEIIETKEDPGVEAVGTFDDVLQLQEAVKELETVGFGRHEISVLGSEVTRREAFGQEQLRPDQLEDNPNTPRSPLVSTEEVAVARGVLIGVGILLGAYTSIYLVGGLDAAGNRELLTVLVGAIIGGVLGSALSTWLVREYAAFFRKQSRNGGVLLWVKVSTHDKEMKAREILEKRGAHHIHLHAA